MFLCNHEEFASPDLFFSRGNNENNKCNTYLSEFVMYFVLTKYI